MLKQDFRHFDEMLNALCAMLSRDKWTPNPTHTALFFRALDGYSLEEVQRAFDAHLRDPQRGRFAPVPADIIAQLEGMNGNDGRPGVEEAWATALLAQDEAATVIWTEEIAQAFGIARPVLLNGDKVGARMAFKEAYERLIAQARRERIPVRWNATIGHDKQERERVLTAAVQDGRLPMSELPALPAPNGREVLLLSAELHPDCPPDVKERLRSLREEFAARASGAYVIGQDGLEKALTSMLKEEAADKVEQALRHQRGSS